MVEFVGTFHYQLRGGFAILRNAADFGSIRELTILDDEFVLFSIAAHLVLLVRLDLLAFDLPCDLLLWFGELAYKGGVFLLHDLHAG